MTRLQPSVLAFVTPSSRNPSISGHHFMIVPARRVVSGMSAVTQAARNRVLRCAVSCRLYRVGPCAAKSRQGSPFGLVYLAVDEPEGDPNPGEEKLVARHEYGTGLSGFLPRSWDHPGCQSWDHLRVVRRGSGCRPLPISSCPATWRHRVAFREGNYSAASGRVTGVAS
jgi:hypothetical protein